MKKVIALLLVMVMTVCLFAGCAAKEGSVDAPDAAATDAADTIRIALDDAARFTMLGPLLGLIVGGLCIIFRHPLVALFATGSNLSPLTISTALAVTVFCSAEVAFRNLPYIHVVGVFRSGGDTLRGMIYDLISLWALSIPAALIAANVLHLPFIYILAAAYLGEDVPKSIMCMRHFLSRRWLKPVTKEGQAGLAAFREEENRHE